ncbi:hypothetical protein TH47_00785 [Thalassospira sp. MCCC 1A02803]|nr:hypothetical protein TH47_00785 [Thalassospira sp. MCCC 1A02803]
MIGKLRIDTAIKSAPVSNPQAETGLDVNPSRPVTRCDPTSQNI